MAAVEGDAGAGARGKWGTWQELVLGAAVQRHGTAAWAAVAEELRPRARCPYTFSPEECEARFAEIQSRYSACDDWYEELRQQRIAQLKREVEESDKSIGSLQSRIESLSNSKRTDGSSDCRTTHTESCSHSGNIAATNSSSKELSRDRSSAASFTEEANNCLKSQQMQRCDTVSVQTNNTSTKKSLLKAIDEKACANDTLFWGSRKQRARRGGRIIQKADASNRDGEPTSTSTTCLETEGSSEGFKEDMKKGLNLKAPNVEPGSAMKGLKTSNIGSDGMKKGLETPNVEPGVMKKGLKTPNLESGVTKSSLETTKLESGVMKNGLETPKLESVSVKNSLKTPEVESGVSEIEREKADLAGIAKHISTQGDCLMLEHQVDRLKKKAAYKKIIRQHMDFETIHDRVKSGAISTTKELLRDILIFVNNIMVMYPKATLEHKAAVEFRDLACKIVNEGASFASKRARAPLAKKNAQAMQAGHHDTGDDKGNEVPWDTVVSARQGEGKGTASANQCEGKDSRSDKPTAVNLKADQISEPTKKRGVGRPPKSRPLKRSAQAPEDSPSRGRKRIRRGP